MADDDLLLAVRGLHLANPELGPKPLLAKLREQQPDLAAGNKEVREALAALKADRDPFLAAAALVHGGRRHLRALQVAMHQPSQPTHPRVDIERIGR